MTRIAICGGPRTGKTTLATKLLDWGAVKGCGQRDAELLVRHTDDLIATHDWSAASQHIADEWLTQPGPWVIEGVAVVRALRKWREAHPDEDPPVDRVIRLVEPHVPLTKGQATMAKGEEKVWNEIEGWLGRIVEWA